MRERTSSHPRNWEKDLAKMRPCWGSNTYPIDSFGVHRALTSLQRIFFPSSWDMRPT